MSFLTIASAQGAKQVKPKTNGAPSDKVLADPLKAPKLKKKTKKITFAALDKLKKDLFNNLEEQDESFFDKFNNDENGDGNAGAGIGA